MITSALDIAGLTLDDVLTVADVVQIGARNAQNYGLLTALGQIDRPVLLKRGMSMTVDETVKAAAYVLAGGNDRVILCERGIRTFETAYRFTLDVGAVPLLKERSGLRVIVDPSHAAGRRDLVLALSKAAVAVGADAIMVEVDEDPDAALSDPLQQLHLADLAGYAAALGRVVADEGRTVLHARSAACLTPRPLQRRLSHEMIALA